MPPFRPPKEHISRLASQVLAAMQKSPAVEVRNPEAVKSIFCNLLEENLREENAIEEEALEVLRRHGQEIYEQKADFQKLLIEGKKVIAKRRNFVL